MVIAVAVLDLLVGSIVDAVTDGCGSAEVKWSALHRYYLACHQYIGIHVGHAVGIQLQHLIEAILRGVAAQVEVAVVGEIEHCGLVGSGLVGNLQCVVVGQGIGNLHVDIAWEAVLTIGAGGGECHVLVVRLLSVPYSIVESYLSTAVQSVAVIVQGKLVRLSVEGELPLGNAVAIASDERTEVATLCSILDVIADGVMSQTHIIHLAVLARHPDAHDAAAKVGEANLHAVLVLQHVEAGGVGLEVVGIEPGERERCLFLCIVLWFGVTRNHGQTCGQCHAGQSESFHLSCSLRVCLL